MIAIFSQIDTLEEFRFRIRTPPDYLYIHPWAEFDRVATRPELSCLRTVRVDVYPGMAGFIKERLPACHERGILQFCEIW